MTRPRKVAFATDDGTNINRHFGRLRGFVVVTVTDGAESARETIARPSAADQPGDRRHNHSALLNPIADCEALVAGGMGSPMAAHVANAGLDLYLTSLLSVDDALDRYLAGSLESEDHLAHDPRH